MKKTIIIIISLILSLSSITACTKTPSDTTAMHTETESVTDTELTTETEAATEPVTEPDFTVTPDSEATLEIPRTFGSHMVVQRDGVISIFGRSSKEGTLVRGSFKDQVVYAYVEDGKFTLQFEPEPASSEPAVMTVEDTNGNVITFDDVLVGDVWIVGGQSNAQVELNYIKNAIGDIPEFDENENVRLLMQSANYYVLNPDSVKEPLYDFGDPSCCWKRQTAQAALEFSALGLFFARRIAERADIPVGVICIAANGAQIQELMSAKAAKKVHLTTSLKVGPGGFYNGMVHPLLGMAFKGMLFFQGESEGLLEVTARKYADYLKAYVADMKEGFGFEFPFYNIQLSSYSEQSKTNFGYVYIVRDEQLNAMRAMGNENLISSYDLRAPDGYADYMHSPRKRELAERAADLALANEYGIGNKSDCESPAPSEITVSEDKTTVTVKFKSTGGGLVSKSGNNTVSGFFIGKTGKKYAAEAEIVSDDTVVIKVPDGASLSYISYAYDLVLDEENAQLYGKNGVPAVAFNISLK